MTKIDGLRVVLGPDVVADDSTEPGWSVNSGRPLWLSEPKGYGDDCRDVIRLGKKRDGGLSVITLTFPAEVSREQINMLLDDDSDEGGPDWDSLIFMNGADVNVLVELLTLAGFGSGAQPAAQA